MLCTKAAIRMPASPEAAAHSTPDLVPLPCNKPCGYPDLGPLLLWQHQNLVTRVNTAMLAWAGHTGWLSVVRTE